MEWRLDFRGNGILEITAFGIFCVDDLIKMAEQIVTNPKWSPGFDAIADFRDVNSTRTRLRDLYLSRDIHAQFDNLAGDGKVAVIMNEDLNYFLSCAYEIIASMYVKSKIKSFKDYDEGVEWICENRD